MSTLSIEEQVALLSRGAVGLIPEKGLEAKLRKSAQTGKPLKVKLGLDPSAPDIHLGFAVVLRKLRQFQDLGHQVILIIGDFTAMIGDPTGRSVTRPMLTREQIEQNASTYVDQLSRILDRGRTTVRFNSEWLRPLGFADLIGLCSKLTIARILEREDFSQRLEKGLPVGMHEILYPLAQGYDSVAIEADVELGGSDQTFNVLVGRDLQTQFGQDPQVALFTPLLVGLDGSQKMSKSLGNYVGISETPGSMFGKLMSISDEMMRDYFLLCTDLPMPEVDEDLERARTGETNPKDVKRKLARAVVSIYHGREAAEAADAEFERIHARHELPAEMPECVITGAEAEGGVVGILPLLVAAGLATSKKEARRLVEQGGVRVNEEKLDSPSASFSLGDLEGAVLQVGPRRFVRLRAGRTAAAD